jgi:calcium-dependent protein kinase
MSNKPALNIGKGDALSKTLSDNDLLDDKEEDSPLAPEQEDEDLNAFIGAGIAFVDITDAVERAQNAKSSSTTDILKAAIPPSGGSSSSKNYVEYRVFVKRRDGQMISFFRRYRKFKEFDEGLRKILPEQWATALKKLPPKERWRRMFGLSVTNDAYSDVEKNQASELTQVERRKFSLKRYIREALRVAANSCSIPAMQFVARFLECKSIHAIFVAKSFMFDLRRLIRVEDNGRSEVWVGRDITFEKNVKVLVKRVTRPKSVEEVRRLGKRVKMARLLAEHPNVIAMHEVYFDGDYICLVRQVSHGNLVEVVTTDFGKKYSESVVLEIATHLLSAISYAHSRNVVHLDLNLESIRFGSEAASDIQMFGFELPYFVEDVKQYELSPVNIFFTAPELLVSFDEERKGGELSLDTLKAADMWSIGVLLFVLGTGRYPFCESNRRDTVQVILNAEFHEADTGISDEFWGFMAKVLLRDPSKRFTAKQAFESQWIKTGAKDVSPIPLDAKVLSGLATIRSNIDLKRRMSFISLGKARSIPRTEVIRCFKAFDADGDGVIDMKKISRKLEALGYDKQDAQTEAAMIIKQYDLDFDGLIQVDSFLATSPTMKWKMGTGKNILTLEDVTKVFRALDKKGTGYVDAAQLEEYCRSHFTVPENAGATTGSVDLHSSNPNLRQGDFFSTLVDGADIDHDGTISFEELVYALQCMDNTIDTAR